MRIMFIRAWKRRPFGSFTMLDFRKWDGVILLLPNRVAFVFEQF